MYQVPMTITPSHHLTMDEVNRARTIVAHHVNYDPRAPRATREELAVAYEIMAAFMRTRDDDV